MEARAIRTLIVDDGVEIVGGAERLVHLNGVASLRADGSAAAHGARKIVDRTTAKPLLPRRQQVESPEL